MHLRLLRICLKAPIARVAHVLLLLGSAAVYLVSARRDAHAAQILAGIALAVAVLLVFNQFPAGTPDGD